MQQPDEDRRFIHSVVACKIFLQGSASSAGKASQGSIFASQVRVRQATVHPKLWELTKINREQILASTRNELLSLLRSAKKKGEGSCKSCKASEVNPTAASS